MNNYDYILIEELKDPASRKKIFDMAQKKVQSLINVIHNAESEILKNQTIRDNQKKFYDINERKFQNRELSSQEFEEFEQNYQRTRDALDSKKTSLEIEVNYMNHLKKRLQYLGWLLTLPHNEEEVIVSQDNKRGVIRKRDLYNKYFESIMDLEKFKLKKEQSLLRLKIDLNSDSSRLPNSNIIPIDSNHEFYSDVNKAKEELLRVQSKISYLEDYESGINKDYYSWMNISELTVGDFLNGNNNQLCEKFFFDNEKRKKA